MKFRIRFAEQIVGLFVFIAIGFLVLIIILMGANQRWFATDYYYSSRFSSGDGLSVGMPITLKGFQIGKVSKISLNEENEVDIVFYVYDTYYEKIKENSILELTSNPLGLGGGLVFHSGKFVGAPLPEFTFIPSLDLPEGQRLVSQGLVDMPAGDDAINRIIGKTEGVMDSITVVLEKIVDVMDSVADISNSIVTFLDDLNAGIKGENTGALAVTLNNVKDITSQLNTDLASIMDNVDDTTANIQTMTEAFKDPTGLIPKLLDAKGSLAAFLDDDNALYDQINSILLGIDETGYQFTEFSKYINTTSPQISGLLEETRDAIGQGKDVMEGLKNNPLLRGGIAEEIEQPTTFQSYRDEDF